MRGCTFAENFVNEDRMGWNNATLQGSGHVVSNGLTNTASGFVEYDVVTQEDQFSVVVRFSTTTAATSTKVLIANLFTDGFIIYLESDGIYARYGSSIFLEAAINVDMDYADGEIHTVSYVVDMGNTHTLYVDDLDSVSTSATADDEIGSTANLTIAGIGSPYNTDCTIYLARIFDQILTEDEHDLYHADTLTDFWSAPWAKYRCDSISDDDVGNYALDCTTHLRDVALGDTSDSDTFPVFDTDHYELSKYEQYLTLPTLPSAYTINACMDQPQKLYPEMQQHNDTTFSALLTSAQNRYFVDLHSITIDNKELTQIEKYHAEYKHKYWLSRGRALGLYHRLITEDTCQLAMFPGSDYYVYRDYSRNLEQGRAYGVTRDGLNGVTFPNSDSNINLPNINQFKIKNGTIALFGTFDSHPNSTYVDRGSNFKLTTASGIPPKIYFYGDGTTSRFTYTITSAQFIAVTFKDGFKPRLYIDGEFHSEGDANFTAGSTVTTALDIGNNNEHNNRCQHDIKQVYIGDEPLTDLEIKALYIQAQIIGATSMEVGNRIEDIDTYTAAAVDQDTDPGGAFQLIDVVVKFNTAPTTSEKIVIKSIRDATGTPISTTEWEDDPSTGILNTDNSITVRFDKRFADDVTIGVDYTNTDGRTINVVTAYQLDQNVV